MSIATRRTTPKERVTSSHKPDAPDRGADVAEAQAGAQSEAAKPRSGSRDNTKFVTPPAKKTDKYDRNAEINRYIRRWKSKNLLWSQAFIDSGQSGKKKPNMRRVYDEVRRPAYCGQRANGYAKGVKVKVAKEHRRYRHGGHAELRLNESGRGSYAGVVKCSSIWSCPTCSATIRQCRSVEIQTAVNKHLEDGGSILFMTLTLRHDGTMPLAFTLDALLSGFRKVIRGKPWDKWRNRLGLIGNIKSVEITLGDEDSWHPHLHVLLFAETKVDDDMLERFRAWLFPRWAEKLDAVADEWNESRTANGQRKWVITPSEAHGVDLQRVDDHGKVIALYISKFQDDKAQDSHTWEVSGEMARGDVKDGHEGDGDTHINPFQLLDDECPLKMTAGERRRKWIEYVCFTSGRQCIRWSPGLKEHFGIDELTDDEIIEQQTQRSVMAWRIESAPYDEALKHNPKILAQAKHAIEDHDWDRLRELLPGHKAQVLDDTGLWNISIDRTKAGKAKRQETEIQGIRYQWEDLRQDMKTVAPTAKPITFDDKWNVEQPEEATPPVPPPLALLDLTEFA